MITAEAPAACAFSAFTAKAQVPRWISAMLPAGKPAKSAASQPLVLVARQHEVDVDRGDGGGHVP